MSQSYGGLVSLVLTGFLLASIVMFSLVALPELVPFFSPALKTGEVTIDVTSSSAQEFEDVRIYVLLNDIEFHRVGVSEGTWIRTLTYARQVELVDAGRSSRVLTEVRLPIGEYNLARISISNASLYATGASIALKVPSNIPVAPVDFVVTEKVPVTLELDIAFDPGTLTVLRRFDPYLYMAVKQEPVHEPSISKLRLIASFGPDMQKPGDDSTFRFGIPSGHEVQNYLLYAKGGSSGSETFDIEVKQTGEFWHGISGEEWFLGGNLTAGSYDVTVHVSDEAPQAVKFLVNIFEVPKVPSDLSRPSFEGLAQAPQSVPAPINEIGLYMERAGSYNIYFGVGSGDFEFYADNEPISVVGSNRTVTLDLSQGFHSFQILPDYSGSGQDTSWLLVFTLIPESPGPSLSPAAVLATTLLVTSATLWTLGLIFTRVVARRVERSSSRSATS